MNLAEELINLFAEVVPILKKEKLPKDLTSTINAMLVKGFYLNRERINIILSYWHLPPMHKKFYDYYFGKKLTSKDEIITGLNKFIKDALWHFGDLESAYLHLIDEENIEYYLKKQEFDSKEFEDRLEWSLIKDIPPKDRGYLGYVSGERPTKHKKIVDKIVTIIEVFERDYEKLKDLRTEEVSEIVLKSLKDNDPDIEKVLNEYEEIKQLKQLDLFSSSKLEENKKILDNTKKEIEETIYFVEGLKKIGLDNQIQYLRNIESIDVYVATSMRNDDEYIEMAEFVKETFNNENIKELNLRYFDPTLCYCESRIDKGIIECLLVRSAKVTIYCAQEGDTFGKDSELAATLVQGKPAIVYVPNDGEASDKRASIFKEFHPLGLQIGLNDGVARGVIVVRTPEECALILRNILTNQLETYIKYEQHGIVLREKLTNSVLRVMSGWGLLESSFWNNFEKTKLSKSGTCK